MQHILPTPQQAGCHRPTRTADSDQFQYSDGSTTNLVGRHRKMSGPTCKLTQVQGVARQSAVSPPPYDRSSNVWRRVAKIISHTAGWCRLPAGHRTE